MRCRLLLLMIAVFVRKSVSLSLGSAWLHSAKMAEQIKILFRVNTPGGPWNIVLDGGSDPPIVRIRASWVKFCPL